jgi:hypothetical protein
MRSISAAHQLITSLHTQFRAIRVGSLLIRSFKRLGVRIRAGLFVRQIKLVDRLLAGLTRFSSEMQQMDYATAAAYLPQISQMQARYAKADRVMADDQARFIAKVPGAKAFYLKHYAAKTLLAKIHQELTYMEYLTHDAKFLLTLPNDTRYKVMAFAMARVRAAMDQDPEAKAAHDAELDAWINAPLDPIIDYED